MLQDTGLELELLKQDGYDAVTAALAARLELPDPSHLQLTQQSAYSKMPRVRKGDMPAISKKCLSHAAHYDDPVNSPNEPALVPDMLEGI